MPHMAYSLVHSTPFCTGTTQASPSRAMTLRSCVGPSISVQPGASPPSKRKGAWPGSRVWSSVWPSEVGMCNTTPLPDRTTNQRSTPSNAENGPLAPISARLIRSCQSFGFWLALGAWVALRSAPCPPPAMRAPPLPMQNAVPPRLPALLLPRRHGNFALAGRILVLVDRSRRLTVCSAGLWCCLAMALCCTCLPPTATRWTTHCSPATLPCTLTVDWLLVAR